MKRTLLFTLSTAIAIVVTRGLRTGQAEAIVITVSACSWVVGAVAWPRPKLWHRREINAQEAK